MKCPIVAVGDTLGTHFLSFSQCLAGNLSYLASFFTLVILLLSLEAQMDTYTKTMLTIITVCVVVVTLLILGSLLFEGHDHDDEHDYGYVEELYEKLEYISHRIDEVEERLED